MGEGREGMRKKTMPKYPEYPDLEKLGRDEEVHEQKLIGLINEEKLEYMGSVVLGLNDALRQEFTGALQQVSRWH